MRVLDAEQANAYLNRAGMGLDEWSRVTDLTACKVHWKNYRAPREYLFNFAYHVAGWLPRGDWKLFQIDGASGRLDPVQASMFGGLLFGADKCYDLTNDRTFLFEAGRTSRDSDSTDLLIANLIYVFLLFELHGYVVASGSSSGQRLGIQDGYIYFFSRDPGLSCATDLIDLFEANPAAAPSWVSAIIAADQEGLPGSP